MYQQQQQSQFYRPAPYTAAQEPTTSSAANPAPQVHRHLPPAIHCPPKRQQPESPVPYNIPTGPVVYIPTGPEVHRPPKRVQHQQPALVSPSATASPRTPQPCHPSMSLTSSPPRHHQAVTPVCKSTSNAAAEIVSTANLVTSKPPRPYTEYTMFYQLEREYILRRLLTNDDDKKSTNSSPSDDDAADGQTALFQNDPLMPARFRDLPLRADWYISGKSKKPTKRKHRKSHGKIGFLELTRMIAARWAKVDDETRKYCKMMAAMELVKYKEDMESYNLYKERLSAMGQIPQDMKERIRKKKMQSKKKKADTMAKNHIVASNTTRAKKKSGGPARASRHSAPPPLPPAILRADPVNSSVMTTPAAPPMLPLPKLEPTVIYQPLAHNSPPIQQQGSNLDNDMEQFISSLVRSPNRPTSAKAITPDRSASPTKKRRLFRDRSAGSTTAAALESIVPLKGSVSGVDLDGIKMTFSGIDENEIAREFSESVHRAAVGPAKAPGRSFDYWDAFAGI